MDIKDRQPEPNVYEIPKGFDSKIVIWGTFALKTLFIFAGIVFLGFVISDKLALEQGMQGVVIGFHALIGLLIVSPRPSHPDRATYEILLHLIATNDKTKYHSIDYNAYVTDEVLDETFEMVNINNTTNEREVA
ncbi:hypothetical protein [Mammaliicoccus sciuri]|uniref:Uncharacterized protein n=1 Tax=Mammaliicoccus sciuri TaxID=1296 RepID=A0AAI8GV84_MAMSC|nr:hypothetical protein [Mammaliicoccus sciuri]ASE35682.1 hypothetical protein CEP64_13765 [Mammaliicoccus sciuri]